MNAIVNIIILSIAGVAITWCSYQSTVWNGIQTFKLASAQASFRKAEEKKEAAMQKILMDEGLMISFVNAVMANDTAKISFYIAHVRPELGAILAGWLKEDPLHNKNAPAHPADMEKYKRFIAGKFAEATEWTVKGEDYWKKAQHANKVSDNYVLITVIFSVVMFLCGVAPRKTPLKLAFALNIVSAVICIVMIIILLITMPWAYPG